MTGVLASLWVILLGVAILVAIGRAEHQDELKSYARQREGFGRAQEHSKQFQARS